MKRPGALILFLLYVLLLIGCSDSTEQPKFKSLNPQDTASIKILYPNKISFFNNYGNYFNSKYPHVDIEVIPTQGVNTTNEIRQLIEAENPDVLFLQMDQYEAFSNEGILLDLEAIIRQSEFDITNMSPLVIETIKSKSNDTIFGLAPTFSSQALYYNKDMFQQYGVPFPKDKMTWDEVLDLANRFPSDGQGENRLYGFAYGTNAIMIRFLYNFASTLGLGFVDQDLTKVTFQTNGWKKAFELTVKAMQSKAFFKSSNANISSSSGGLDGLTKSNLFLSQRAAMTIDNISLITNRLQIAKPVLKDSVITNWGVVTIPVNPQNPDLTSQASVSQFFSINAKTTNLIAAWELVKIINGDEYAKLQSRSTNELLSRSKHMQERDGNSLQAFYTLKPTENVYRTDLNRTPAGFSSLFDAALEQEVNAVIAGEKSTDEALKSLEIKAQDALNKLKKATVK